MSKADAADASLRASRIFEAPHDSEDSRSPFERDRDRVLYSTAFRRLAGVTQVVHAGEGHVFHNRLTHSVKVAQIARRIAERLERDPREETKEVIRRCGLDASVVETAALIHDMGHPPFGHAAEHVLDKLCIASEVPEGFEGNAQSFRIVTKVATRNAKEQGLNLTKASLNAILKYPWSRGEKGTYEYEKRSFYESEAEEFHRVRELGPATTNRCLEADIMNWADDVAYSVHDVDDFYKAGLVPLDRLLQKGPEQERFISGVIAYWTEKKALEGKPTFDEALQILNGSSLNWAPEEIREPFVGNRQQRAALNFFASELIGQYVKNFSVEYREGGPFISIPEMIIKQVNLLKDIMWYYVFTDSGLASQQYGHAKVITYLFTSFMEASTSKRSSIIPYPFRDYLDELKAEGRAGEDEKRLRTRIVVDLIASMTEQQALAMYQRLSGATPGTIMDLIYR
ncbi:MAG TPA: dNTP triphosphohydrolase [Oscillatoriaceae cyanobacterium]